MNSSNYSFSIIVVTYNSDWTRLRLTLDSILSQDFKDFEIIVADDGSKINHKDDIVAYFKSAGFIDYKLLMHEKNSGTVGNLISALEASSGKYIRDFGSGDFFYSEDTLRLLYEFMEAGSYEISFGMVQGFIGEAYTDYVLSDFYHPFDLEAYRLNDNDRILKNLIYYRDNPSGSSTTYTREVYLKYLKIIEGHVKYIEDIFILLAALDGIYPAFFEDYITYYEMEASVVEKNTDFKKLVTADIINFYNLIYKLFPNNKYVRHQKREVKYYNIFNKYIRTGLRLLNNPGIIGYLREHKRQITSGSYRIHTSQRGFLDKA